MNTKAFLLAILTVAIWGSSFAAISASLNGGYPPGHLALFRFLIASLIFLLIALWPGSKFKLPEKQDGWKIIILGWIGISLYHICVTFGQMTISAGTAGMLIGSAPIVTTVMAVIILKERLGKVGWVGLAFGFIGIILIAFGTGDSSFDISPGVFLVLIAAIATSIFFVYQKPLFKKYSAIELTAYFTWTGTLPFLFFAPGLFDTLQSATNEANLSAIYIGIFPTALAYLTWAIALSQSNASSVSNTLYAEPVVAIVITWIWLHELPSPLSIVGGVIAISSLLFVNLYGKKQRLSLQQKKLVKSHT
ncbi:MULTISPECIES: DMT family transporter [Psychrobacillus]|uniref:DMT family transporter n=1 Tax=Psychrobacillus faecigallinarum TaxID=2762235 RepID=A0ABR8R8V9_9BACI|nr:MULTISPECIES: DMT family transporter [Psychrobacillus]MBD7944246.1 DMT family transporter [Psychrobacillus faecigallinarum]QEY21102.1 DMT family transporter [Psychrobacillus sp. AK 1817]